MANCLNCGAPLPPHTIVCDYCKARNDTDLKGIGAYMQEPYSKRMCPRCDKEMKTIRIEVGDKFDIERCDECLGLFFDPNELEAILQASVSHVFDVDYLKLDGISKARRHDHFKVQYIKCPVCANIMNRVNFGARSGVVVDRCKVHGVWLDGGELRHLMEWMKAGGKLLDEKRQEENRQEQEAKLKKLEQYAASLPSTRGTGTDYWGTLRNDDLDLYDIVKKAVFKLFF